MTWFEQGVAPFRGFVQERVALARRSLDKNGPNALEDWGSIKLFYGCRREDEDYLYKDEWPKYTAMYLTHRVLMLACCGIPGKGNMWLKASSFLEVVICKEHSSPAQNRCSVLQ